MYQRIRVLIWLELSCNNHLQKFSLSITLTEASPHGWEKKGTGSEPQHSTRDGTEPESQLDVRTLPQDKAEANLHLRLCDPLASFSSHPA